MPLVSCSTTLQQRRPRFSILRVLGTKQDREQIWAERQTKNIQHRSHTYFSPLLTDPSRVWVKGITTSFLQDPQWLPLSTGPSSSSLASQESLPSPPQSQQGSRVNKKFTLAPPNLRAFVYAIPLSSHGIQSCKGPRGNLFSPPYGQDLKLQAWKGERTHLMLFRLQSISLPGPTMVCTRKPAGLPARAWTHSEGSLLS